MSNLFSNRIVSGAASKAVTGNLYQSQQSSLNLKKEVFEHKDCITISTYQSLYVLETCNSILESVLDSMDDEDDESSVVMLSSVIAAFIYSHDFNNSKIIKKRIQLMMDNKLVKTTAIQDNDYFTGYGVLDLNSEMPDMTEDVKYEDFQQKFYNPVFEKKLLISLQAVLSNEIMLLHQKMKHLEHRVKFDFSKSMNKYFVGLTDEFVKVYDLIPQFAVVLEDDTSEVYHLLTGLHTMSNVLTTVKAVYKDDILEFINADIMEFKNPFYSLHQLYGALLAQSRMITVLVNMAKQFLHTNVNYIKEGELVLNDDPALINILNSLMQIDAKILHPAINLCSEFCVENSMLVNQNENVVFNLKEKYSDKLNNLFDNLTELLGDMVDVLMINFEEEHTDVNVDAQKNYFKSMEAMVSKTQKSNPNLKYAYIPSRMDSLDSTKRNQHYTKVGSSDALNSKITKTAGSFSQMSISSMSSASSQTASPSNSTGSSRQNSMSNEKKIVRTRQPTTPSKPTGRTRASSVSSNASVVVGRARGSSVSSNASAAPGRSRSSSVNSAFHNTLKLSPLKKNNVPVAKTPTKVPQEETSADTSSTSYDADAADEYKKVRFQGVPKYPMVYESIKPTRKGWYSKPAVLHYPLIPDQYSSSIDSINTVPVSKERQMEGFAFKHINSLFKKIKD